ncbi:phage tail sheath C-terminal domain-containing protein [Burkholderia cenocepacia]|uniref:phage tail sheath C-terminal domain-containing protein n=1 Tax=Burkholderia cenocepacia TaxID=95486 RepID=UPI000F591AE7|nr:phage tail sheath C-terminal domain-containing protein [Burkholderia cenocepacia]RQU52926.1 hypothetical protein DF143_32660 [Burkholderia cenocepacia]RQV35046.1 hypothetical protein DF033_31980 [Burkholderia cenocepacia]
MSIDITQRDGGDLFAVGGVEGIRIDNPHKQQCAVEQKMVESESAMQIDGNAAWRYIAARSLFCEVGRDIGEILRTVMFEANDIRTWTRVRALLDTYLSALWHKGTLLGDSPEAAYFVQVGLGLTMRTEDVESGRMIVIMGMAPIRPAKFMTLQFVQRMLGTSDR